MVKHKSLTIAVIAFLLLALPATIYLALTKQLIFKKAAFGEVTVNLVPTQATKNVGEIFPVEVFMSSGEIPISAATIEVNYDRSHLSLGGPPQGTPEVEAPFEIINRGNLFTIVAKKPTSQLPKGTFKVGTVTFQGLTPSQGNISLDLSKTQIIGANEQNEDVSLTVKEGTKVSYTITGEENICRTGSCPTNIQLKEEARDDGRFNIQVSWEHPQREPSPLTFRVFRNIGAPVPADHPAANLAGTSQETSFLDTNNNQGFEGKTEVHYDIDAYQACSESGKTQAIAPPPPGTSYFIGGLNCNPQSPPEGGTLVRCSALYCEDNPSIPCQCKDAEYSPCDQLPDHVRNDPVFVCNSSTKQCLNSYSVECANTSSFSFSCEEIDFGVPLNQRALWSVTGWTATPTPTPAPSTTPTVTVPPTVIPTITPISPSPTAPSTTPTVTVPPTVIPTITPTTPPKATVTPIPPSPTIIVPSPCRQDAKIILPAGPTATPSPIVTPPADETTPIVTPPAGKVSLKFKIKFQGVDWGNLPGENAQEKWEKNPQKVKLTVIKQVYQQVGTLLSNLQNQEPVTIMSKEFADVEVKPEKVGADPIAIWSGQVTLTGVPADSGYSILIKGPKHLQRKFCQDKPTEKAEEGYPYQCKGPGKIALTAGEMELDFSGVLLQGGDLPGPQGQDGVVNAHDVSLIISILKTGQSEKEEDLKRADIDLNGIVNFKDRSYLIETLEEKYGDEE